MVRVAAAGALADLCDMSHLDELSRAAHLLLEDYPSPDEVAVGTGALLALGRIAPADLEARLAPFAARTDRPTVTHQVEQARVASQCSGSPGAPRP